jgi:hypothetical protein
VSTEEDHVLMKTRDVMICTASVQHTETPDKVNAELGKNVTTRRKSRVRPNVKCEAHFFNAYAAVDVIL